MTIFNLHLFHSYSPIYKNQNYNFEGKTLTRKIVTDYVLCKECDKIARYDINHAIYTELTKEEQEIVRCKYILNTLDSILSLIPPKQC